MSAPVNGEIGGFYSDQLYSNNVNDDSAFPPDWQPFLFEDQGNAQTNINNYNYHQEVDYHGNSIEGEIATTENVQDNVYTTGPPTETGNLPVASEAPPDENLFFEVITKAHCIDCDKLVDTKKDKHRSSDCTLRKDYFCDKCPMGFNHHQNLLVHSIVAHLNESNFSPSQSCCFCEVNQMKPKSFQRYAAYISHIKGHLKCDNFICSVCGEEFEFSALYHRHRRIAHQCTSRVERRGFSRELGFCAKCEKLIELSKVDSHRLVHSIHSSLDKKVQRLANKSSKETNVQTNYKNVCEICSKSFRRPSELRRHLAVHQNVTRYACDLCDKKFSHKSGLLCHVKQTHSSSPKKHVCRICQMSFTKLSNLDRHIRNIHPIDSNRTLFDCSHCLCQFSTSAALQKHVNQCHPDHVVITTYTCDICSMDFPKKSALERHKGVHVLADTDKPFRCNRCFKRYKLRSSLKLHMDIHSRKDIDDPVLTDPKCPICMKHLSSQSSLKKHMLIHESSYECPDCCQRFATIHRLDKHKCSPIDPPSTNGVTMIELSGGQTTSNQQVQRKCFSCKQCPSSFYSFKAFKEHKSLHQRLRPHVCWTCHKSFRTIDQLRKHKEIHNRTPFYCEQCPVILSGRAQLMTHMRSCHPVEPQIVEDFRHPDFRLQGALSSQSFPAEFTGKELAEGLFSNRAQSAEPNTEDFMMEDDNSWMHNTQETVHIQPVPQHTSQCVSEITTADRAVRCPVCYHLYHNIASLTEHFTNMINETTHSITGMKCVLCEYSLRGSAEAADHMRMEHPYMPSSDTMLYNRPTQYIGLPPPTNMQISRPPPKCHACSQCGKSFSKSSDVKRHERIHSGERPYECDVCQRAFRVRSTLISHMKTHERGSPQEQCNICEAKFFTRNALTLHLRMHSGEKPLMCRYCDESFRTSASRLFHEKSTHQNTVHKCQKKGCRVCMTKRMKMNQLALPQRETIIEQLNSFINEHSTSEIEPNSSSTALYPVKRYALQPVEKNLDKNLMDTVAQISHVEGSEIYSAKDLSAFSTTSILPTATTSTDHDPMIHITAKRISDTEYSVCIAKYPPKAIREGVDTSSSMLYSVLRKMADRNTSFRMTLMDCQQLNINADGALTLFGGKDNIVLKALPYNMNKPEAVSLMSAEPMEFCRRCDICDVNFMNKCESDSHFASEDHEVAQTSSSLHAPSVTGMFDNVHHNLSLQPVPVQRQDGHTCRICKRNFDALEPFLTHIRRDHEEDHPHNFVPRVAARTAPPLERNRLSN